MKLELIYGRQPVREALRSGRRKIDKLFVDSICTGKTMESFVDTIVMMGRKMGLVVLAEGVEKKEQMDYLLKYKCHKAQGYYISKPIPEDRAIELCKEWSKENDSHLSNW